MSTPNAQASSSKRNPQGSRPRNGGKGKGQAQPKIKSNQAKRLQADEELKELQSRIDDFVRGRITAVEVQLVAMFAFADRLNRYPQARSRRSLSFLSLAGL